MAALTRSLGDLDQAEESVQDAFEAALRRWPAEGIPHDPVAWIVVAARNRAIDVARRRKRLQEKLPRLVVPEETMDEIDLDVRIPDERLELIFMCCHPALNPDAQVALTLRSLGGLTTTEIARAFIVSEATLAQRLVRAKRKIKQANIPFGLPPDHRLAERLDGVLAVLYLIFNEGYSASTGDRHMRADLCLEAIRLADVVVRLMPDEPEPLGLQALMLFQHSRADARVDESGSLILLEDQDRDLWDEEVIASALRLLERAGRLQRPGPYQVQASIAAVHALAAGPSETDWHVIAELYRKLEAIAPTAVVRLNRAVAVMMDEGPEAGLAIVEDIEAGGRLSDYHLLHATKAHMMRRLGREADALRSYERALELTSNPSERAYLLDQMAGPGD